MKQKQLNRTLLINLTRSRNSSLSKTGCSLASWTMLLFFNNVWRMRLPSNKLWKTNSLVGHSALLQRLMSWIHYTINQTNHWPLIHSLSQSVRNSKSSRTTTKSFLLTQWSTVYQNQLMWIAQSQPINNWWLVKLTQMSCKIVLAILSGAKFSRLVCAMLKFTKMHTTPTSHFSTLKEMQDKPRSLIFSLLRSNKRTVVLLLTVSQQLDNSEILLSRGSMNHLQHQLS